MKKKTIRLRDPPYECLSSSNTQTIHIIPVSKRPLIRTGKSLTMFITDIQEQLKSTRCWRQAGQARRRPPGRMRSGTRSGFWALKATKGQQWFWYTCWASGNWTPSVGGGKKTTHSQLSKEARKPKPKGRMVYWAWVMDSSALSSPMWTESQ